MVEALRRFKVQLNDLPEGEPPTLASATQWVKALTTHDRLEKAKESAKVQAEKQRKAAEAKKLKLVAAKSKKARDSAT